MYAQNSNKHLDKKPYLPYQIIGPLGDGGYGHVYKAWDTLTQKIVALKTLSPDITSAHATFRLQALCLEREYSICNQISHPHIVSALAYHRTENGLPFAIFQYLPGETLHHRLMRRGSFSGEETATVMGQMLKALVALHSRGVVHRDIKPMNVMVHEEGTNLSATLIDLGISTWEGASYAPVSLPLLKTLPQGSVHYSAPGQWMGEEARPQHDWFAWALVVIECLTGQGVLNGLSPQQAMRKKNTGIDMPASLASLPVGQFLRSVLAGGAVWNSTAALLHDWNQLTLPDLSTGAASLGSAAATLLPHNQAYPTE